MNIEQLSEVNNEQSSAVSIEQLNEVNNKEFKMNGEQPQVNRDNQKGVRQTTSANKRYEGTSVLRIIDRAEIKDTSSGDDVNLSDCTEVLNVHIDEDFQVLSNTVMTTSVKINRSITNDRDIILSPCVIKDSIAVASILTNVRGSKIKVQLANLSEDDIILKAGTRPCDGQYLNNETVRLVNVDTDVTANDMKLRDLTLDDVQCDYAPAQVLELVNLHRNACWLPGETLGKYTGDQLEIKLKKDVVINKPPYRMPYAFQKQLDSVIQTMLKDGVITRSKSSYNGPLIIVQREGRAIRPCLDYRALNEICEDILYPLPRMPDILNSVGNSLFMSTLDLVSAYYQLQTSPKDRHKSAFTVNNSKYEFVSVPFGLKKSPAFFARVINEVLYKVLGP